ncbi:MAG: carboxypeptidase regulatory-like domain-containing protein [Vicinamibacterales bacterium]
MLRPTVVILLLLTGVLSAQAPRESDTTVLPVSRVVLYKTGIGYFEHLTTVTGNESIAVQFTGDQLDDVLKSLTAVDLGTGRIAGISYDSPTPADRRLQALRVPLAEDATTLQVLEALRGSRVEVRSAAGTLTAGRLLHVDRRVRVGGEISEERDEITLMTDAGDITTLELGPATRVRLADADLRQDLGRYLDIAATNGDRSPRRVVIATVGSGARQVLVSYVGEAAVWKTTYRLVFPSAGTRQPFLQGWAVVDNLSAADWNDVELSLVAGAPQAFRQPLSTPLFATRPFVPLAAGAGLAPQLHAGALTGGASRIAGLVRDSSGGALPGVTVVAADQQGRDIARTVTDASGRYELSGIPAGAVDVRAELSGFQTTQVSSVSVPSGGMAQQDVVMGLSNLTETITVSNRSPRTSREPTFRANLAGVAAPAPPPPPAVVAERLEAQIPAASGVEMGDLFEYKLTDRVTIRRNQSALVPILQTSVQAERISLWNDAMGFRPRRAVWITNASDLTLDAGSLSIVDGGFAGEGLIESIGPGGRRLVSYAADAGVQVNARRGDATGRTRRLRIARGVVTEDTESRRQRIYTLRNDDREGRAVIVEHPAEAGWTLAGTTKAEESTAAVHRFRVDVPAGQTVTLTVDETRSGATTYTVGELDGDRVLRLASTGDRRAEIERALGPVREKAAELDRVQADLERIGDEISRIGTSRPASARTSRP